MFLRFAWGPVLGALLASGWWALAVWGFPASGGGDTSWRVPVAGLTFCVTGMFVVGLMVAMAEDCWKSFPNVEEGETD